MKNLHALGLLLAVAVAALGACDLYFPSQSGPGGGNECNAGCLCISDPNDCLAAQCNWTGSYCSNGWGLDAGPPDSWPAPDADAGSDAPVADAPPGNQCTTDTQCYAGYNCSDGNCVPGGLCGNNGDCAAGSYCNVSRSTCEPGTAPTSSCGGTVTCATEQPTCPSGQVPTISDGCWTGTCEEISSCDVPPACSEINDATDCLARSDCSATYTGIDCTTSNGTACTSGDTGCTCASFEFASCTTKS